MKVAVHYMAQLRQAACLSSEEIELDRPCPARELVARLAERHGGPLRRLLLDEGGAVQPTVLLFVGDEQVGPGPGADLRDGDVLTLLTPIAGG